jgi:hypothetical protein
MNDTRTTDLAGKAHLPMNQGDDKGDFDESRFAPRMADQATYDASVTRGYGRMRGSRVVIAGLARDIEAIVNTTIARIERLGSMFRDYRAVIYENDSADQTRQKLHDWQDQNPRVTIISEDRNDPVNLPSRCLSRAARMAYYRGQCHQLISRGHARYDHVIIVDTDLYGGWSYDGIAHTFGQDDWDFVGANGIIYRRRWLQPNTTSHYDAWAFRVDSNFTPLTTKQVNHMRYDRGQPMQRVYSCFGGLGIYRMPAFMAGRYDGSDIEHVTFHREMHRRGFGRTFLNPSLIAVYGRKHRSMDPLAAKVIRVLDVVLGRRQTTWEYPAPTQKPATDLNPSTGKRAA